VSERLAEPTPTGYRASHLGKGADYHELFSQDAPRAVMWELEKQVLSKLIESLFESPPALLDFACGTGRIAGHLERKCASALGVDVSPSMLEVARKNTYRTELLRADIIAGNQLAGRQFDLITAFRFFPNAEDELRIAAMNHLATLLSPAGYLIFNNHKNDTSLMLKVARAVGRGDPHNMSAMDVERIVGGAGLRVRASIPLGYLNWTHVLTLRPRRLALSVERQLMKISRMHRLAQNVIYVCSR